MYVIPTKNLQFLHNKGTLIWEGFLLFQSKTGINQARIPLQQQNRQWYIKTYSQALAISNKMHNMLSDIIYSMSGIALHNLWYNQLCHTSHDAIKDIHKHCERILNLESKMLYFIVTAVI